MYLHGLIFSLASVGCVSAAEDCNSEEYITAHTTLIKKFELFRNDSTMIYMRPITRYSVVTSVFVQLIMSSITDVNEKAQSISTQVTIFTAWIQELNWDPFTFCKIFTLVVRTDLVWTPDIVIQESIKTEFATKETPYVELYNHGMVQKTDILSLTTACKMDLYKFPFDTQICNLTLRSLAHSDDQIKFLPPTFPEDLVLVSQHSFQTQGEWELVYINASTSPSVPNMWLLQSQLVFQITIRRRPLLYIINLIFPVFCFLVLDVASFFIYASEAEKLSFKVTLLLSISVLLLILNDKLPSTASKVPLIGIYCSVIFTLIGLSILEIIFVNILIAKGRETRSDTSVKTTAAETGQNDGVRDLQNPLDTVTSRNEELTCTLNTQKKASLCWTRVARIIDVTYIVTYVITIIVFLSVLGKAWFLL